MRLLDDVPETPKLIACRQTGVALRAVLCITANLARQCPLRAKSGHSPPLIRSPGQQWRVGWRYREAEFLSRLEVHHELIVLALNGQARRDWAQRASTRRMARA